MYSPRFVSLRVARVLCEPAQYGGQFDKRHPKRTRGKLLKTVPFKHGQYQVGEFEQVVHAGTPWKGKRGVISSYLGELAQPDDFRNSGPFSPWPFSSRFAARWSTSPEKKFVKLGRDSLLRPLSRTGGELVALSWGPGLFSEVSGTRLRFFGDGWVPIIMPIISQGDPESVPYLVRCASGPRNELSKSRGLNQSCGHARDPNLTSSSSCALVGQYRIPDGPEF